MAAAFKPHTPVGRWTALLGGLLLIEMLVALAVAGATAPTQSPVFFLLSQSRAWAMSAAFALILGVIGLLHYSERSVSNWIVTVLGLLITVAAFVPPAWYW
ncbi:hypothetical protein ACFVWT_11235 [Arthrobacter sp. NPDC058288]|uniref:hypothetical protein n=1 Tax=Arthrobacter sp. NPDC058288 TaxID=3346424 RepID=UPI0036E2F34F